MHSEYAYVESQTSTKSVTGGFSNPVNSIAVGVDENIAYNAHEGMVVTENLAYDAKKKSSFVPANKETTWGSSGFKYSLWFAWLGHS